MNLQEEKLTSLCNGLEDESKSRRRSTLTQLREETFDKSTEQVNADKFFEIICKPVLKSFSDSAEKCRELAILLLHDFLPKLSSIDKFLTYIIAVVLKRIGDDDNSETSEEIRLLLISFLCRIIEQSGKSVLPYLNDITKIICKGLGDSYPKVKSESCECILVLTKAIPKEFHVQSETYVKALMQVIAHKHSKVRAISIKALGASVQYGTHGLVEQVTGGLAERLYDSNFAVRHAVISVGGEWLLKLNDRYSHFARLLPLVLTGLDDTLPEIVDISKNLWEQAGAQFLAENEEEFKNQIDFLTDTLPDVQLQEHRPSLGCRLLVQREAAKLLPASLAELHDWTVAVRLQAASLLYQLVRHLEHRSTQHVAKLWPDFSLVCADEGEDGRLHDKVKSTIKLLGHFLPPTTLLSVAIPQEHLSLGQLRCLTAALLGVKCLTHPELGTLSDALAATKASSLQLEYQQCLVICVQTLIQVAEKNSCNNAISLDMLKVLLCAQGFGDPTLTGTTQEVLEQVVSYAQVTPEELYTKHGQAILCSLVPTVPTWTDHCAEKNLFVAFVQSAGVNIGSNLMLLSEILVTWSKITNSAKSLADFLRVAQILLNWSFLATCHPEPGIFFTTVLNEAIIPNLVWKAGRVAEAKRSQSLLCLLIAVSNPDVPPSIIQSLQTSLLPLLVSGLEESNKMMRMHATQLLGLLCPHWASQLSEEHVHKTYQALARRLDDTGAEVRVLALTTLQNLLLSLPLQHAALSNTTHLEDLYKMILIHLDDQDPIYQQAILESLKKLGKFESKLMLDLVRKGQKNFRNQDGCNCLKLHLEELLSNQ